MGQLWTELRTNIRLQAGLVAIIIILVTYGLLSLDEYRLKLIKDLGQQHQRLAQLSGVVAQTEWQQRAEASRALRVQLEDKLWKANTIGLAQANFQAWLENNVRKHVPEARFRVDTPIEIQQESMNLWQIKAQIDGIFLFSKVNELLLNIANQQQWVIVDRLETRQSGNDLRLTLVLSVYFLLPAKS